MVTFLGVKNGVKVEFDRPPLNTYQESLLNTTKLPMSNYYSLEAFMYLSFSYKRETRFERATFTLAR
jgi:hypothetical protein